MVETGGQDVGEWPPTVQRIDSGAVVRLEIAVAAATLRVDSWAVEVAQALSAQGVSPILLKGPSVARALYPHGGARPYVDVDLLIEPARMGFASEVLGGAGFERVTTPVIDGRLERHSEPWRRAEDGALVDVHRTLPWLGVSPETAWEVLARETEPIRVAATELMALTPPALALHVALHAVYHGRAVEASLRDLELAVERWDDGVWSETRRVATSLGALGALRAALTMVPAGRPLAHRLDLPEAFSREIRLAALGPPGATELERLSAHRSSRDRIRIVSRQLVPPRAFMYEWSPRARRGPGWLLIAYLDRLRLLARRIGPATAAYLEARRGRKS